MANLSDNKPVYHKTFSYKTISGGIMRVGSLVKTPVNGVGIIIDTKTVSIGDYCGATAYLLHYINGEDGHWWTADHLEVICE